MRSVSLAVLATLLALPAFAAAAANPWLGTWNATATSPQLAVPFHFELVNGGKGIQARLFNGSEAVVSDSASADGNHLRLHYDAFDRVLDLQRQADGSLNGSYGPAAAHGGAVVWTIQAQRAGAAAVADQGAPNVDGLWIVPAQSKKHDEHAWRLITHQDFGQLSASILRVGGDTGALTGLWRGGQWNLANFSGTRAEIATIRPEHSPAGDLLLQVDLTDIHGGHAHYTAYRPETARKLGLPEAADLSTHTGVRDPHEVFAFSFKDLDGKLVSNTDPRFQHKVVLLDVSGSWCPNCHDEAPFLDALYRKYHARGLEIVTVDFEDADEYANPTRLRAFVQHYRPPFPVLLAGTTDQTQEKLPQAENLDSWPTTFFIDREGHVQHVHSGFSAAATGDFHSAIETEFEQQIETLLARKG